MAAQMELLTTSLEPAYSAERWLPVVGYEGSYEVSDQGRVRSVDRVVQVKGRSPRPVSGRILRQTPSHKHLVVGLHKLGRQESRLVHRLVLEAFVGPCLPGMEGCHYDDDPLKNHLGNLRWDTRSANSLDRVRNGIQHHANKTHCPQGHEYTAENVRWRSDGGRDCRACMRKQAREYMRRKRQQQRAA